MLLALTGRFSVAAALPSRVSSAAVACMYTSTVVCGLYRLLHRGGPPPLAMADGAGALELAVPRGPAHGA